MSELDYWRTVITSWRSVIALDLHQRYQMDDGAPGFWDQPFWRLRERITGLLDMPDTRWFHVMSEAVTQQLQHDEGAAGAA
jgi:hypothetical protein